MANKDKDTQIDVNPSPKTTVTETVGPEKKELFQNPFLTCEVHIHGLPVNTRTGLRSSLMKAVRAWIRARGLSITLDKVIIEDTEGAGNEVEHEGETVRADLKVIRFTEECLAANNVVVSTPQPRTSKVEKVGLEKETKKIEPAPKAKAVKAKTKAEVKKEVAAQEEDVPSDW